MHIFSRWRLFQKAAVGILVVFMGLMVLVTVVAHARKSGSTRQDMSQAQVLRKQALIGAGKALPQPVTSAEPVED